MTNEEVSYNTKKALADTLKELMTRKPFSKITVSEIIRECNVNRKTFYYHFEDIYSLLKWIFEQEAIDIVKKYDLINDYTDVINFVFDYVQHNAFIISCTYDSLGRDVLKSFFYQDFISITRKIIISMEETLDIRVSDDLLNFHRRNGRYADPACTASQCLQERATYRILFDHHSYLHSCCTA